MRKPRDYDAELKEIDERARLLKERRVVQLGELVVACGANALPIELLAGALLDAAASQDAALKEGWRARGAAFFQRKARSSGGSSQGNTGGAPASDGGTPPAAGEPGA